MVSKGQFPYKNYNIQERKKKKKHIFYVITYDNKMDYQKREKKKNLKLNNLQVGRVYILRIIHNSTMVI